MGNEELDKFDFDFDSTNTDFSPDLTEDTLKATEREPQLPTTSSQSTEIFVVQDDVLAMDNLVRLSGQHVKDFEKCRTEADVAIDYLSKNLHKLTFKEVIDYLNALTRREQYHSEVITKVYNFIIKTDFAKRLLAGSAEKRKNIGKKDKKGINDLINLFKETEEYRE